MLPFAPLSRVSSRREVFLGFKSVLVFGVLRSYGTEPELKDAESHKMRSLLDGIRARLATRAVDKVYGSLSVMPSDMQRAVTVDVSLNQEQVYAGFAKCLLGRGNASLVLSHASHSPSAEILPSWCPNLIEAPVGEPFISFNPPDGFAAGHEPTPSGKRKIHFSEAWDTIGVTGFVFDVILETVRVDLLNKPPAERVANTLEWHDACLTMARQFL
jgi:hypothetical protein